MMADLCSAISSALARMLTANLDTATPRIVGKTPTPWVMIWVRWIWAVTAPQWWRCQREARIPA